MNRQDFISVVPFAWPVAARAQQKAMPVIGLPSASIVWLKVMRRMMGLGWR